MKQLIRIIAVMVTGLGLVRAENRYEAAMELANQGRIEEAVGLLEKPADNHERILLCRSVSADRSE